MKTKSREDSPSGLFLQKFGEHVLVTQVISPKQAELDAMGKGYLMGREIHSLYIDHMDAQNDWRIEHAKGANAHQGLVRSLYGRLQRITMLLLEKGIEPIDWAAVGADVLLVRQQRLDRTTGVLYTDPLTPVTPYIQDNAAGRILRDQFEETAERHRLDRQHRLGRQGQRNWNEEGPRTPVLSDADVTALVAAKQAETVAAAAQIVPTPEPEPAVEQVVEAQAMIDPTPEPLPMDRIAAVNEEYAAESETEPTPEPIIEAAPVETTVPYGLTEIEPPANPIETTMEPLVKADATAEPEATPIHEVPLTPAEIQAASVTAAECCTALIDILDSLPKQIIKCSCGTDLEVGK